MKGVKHINMASKSCIIVGEGNIALTCLKHLLENGFKVNGVFTNTTEIVSFCEQSFIEGFPRRMRIEDVVKSKSFDYLFSINNPTILSEDALSLARHLSINYHDSLLPSYAGVHATSWAIMQGETIHGISWHVVEPAIDTGDILQSQQVEITESDSAFSLNMKCLEAAICAFKRLISDVINCEIQHSHQDFSRRSYFGLYRVPPNLGVLDFTQGIEKTYNLARALEFGVHDNRLGSPKIRTQNGHFLLVTKVNLHNDLENLNRLMGSREDVLPDTVAHIHDNTLLVTTEDGALSLAVSELDGRHLSPGQLDKYSLKIGSQLSVVIESLDDNITLLPKKEQFWRQKMKSYEPTTMYIQKLKVSSALDMSADIKTTDIALPDLQLPEMTCELDEFVAASFIAFLARTSCTSSVHIGLVAKTNGINPFYVPLYAEICPGVFKTDLSAPVKDSIQQCVKTLLRHQEAKTFLLDMFYRYPELREIKRTPHHNLVLGFENDNLSEDQKRIVLSDSNLLVVVCQGKITVSYFDKPNHSHSHVEELLRHFPTFLLSLKLNDSTNTLLDVNLVSPKEVAVLYKLPEHTQYGDESNGVISLFRQVCASNGDATAVKTTDMEITYVDLLDEVCSLASLISANLPQTYRTDLRCMALYMPNSISYVAGVLSSMICFNPFMPVPENTPLDRMAFMLKDSRVTVILTTAEIFASGKLRNLSSTLDVLFKVQTSFGHLVMLHFEMNARRESSSPHSADTIPEVSSMTSLSDMDEGDGDDVRLEPDCCYIMYTSGSTGRPKGVQVKVSGVYNLAIAQIDKWDICPEDTIAQFASIGFDATVSEIFTAVLSGACLAVLKENERLGREFIDTVDKLQITVITLPPSVLNIYGPSDFPSLKKVVTAGEACTFSTAMRWTRNTSVRFFNAYGPTETTVCATVYEYFPDETQDIPSMELPIGTAINGVQVYLFDDFLKPVPPGVVGEIYIGGQGLSAGYIGHANKKNTERFIQSPLDYNSRLYKTGDHALQDSNGCLTYIGRLDDQVKIRGQRIDLNEIEQVLLQHEKIDMAVVVKHHSKMSPDACIAAFVAPSHVIASELREYLARALPCYMIPTYIKRIDVKDFPLTVNGKIDRKKLERDQTVVEKSVNEGSSHLSEIELSSAKIWCRVLQLDESHAFNMHRLSTFSEFGGNSLHMVLLQRTIEEEFDIQLSFTEIGGASSLEDFAELITMRKDSINPVNEKNLQANLKHQLMQDSILDVEKLAGLINNSTDEVQHFEPQNILLSGSTGFLGAFLLYETLQQCIAHMYCMVREKTELRGYGRIVENMKKYNLWKPSFESRITVVLSDLSKPNLGIGPNLYNSLALTTDVVFANAAKMNFNTDYNDHKKANIEGTFEFIKFALTGRKKYLFSTSSLAVFLFPPCSKSKELDIPPRIKCLKNINETVANQMEGREACIRRKEKDNFNGMRAPHRLSTVNEMDSSNQNEISNLIHEDTDVWIEKKQSFVSTNKSSLLNFVNCQKRTSLQSEHLSFNEKNKPHCFHMNGNGSTFNLNDVTKHKLEKCKKRIVYGEDDEIQDPSILIGGYGQSKWVSERLVFQALDYLPGGAVFRPARISGHSQTGIGPTDDLFACLLKGIPQLGYAPDMNFPYDLTPVDYCAGGMVEIMLQMCRGENGMMPHTYHFFNQSTINFLDLFEGASVKALPLDEWREKVRTADRENPLLPLAPFIHSPFWDRSPDWPVFSTKQTDRFVSSDCKKRQPHSRSLLQVYKNFFTADK